MYTREDFDLKSPLGRFRFFGWLYKFPSAFPPSDKIPGIKSRLADLKRRVDNQKYDGFTTRPTKRPKKQAPPNGNHTGHFDNPSTSQMLSKAGYQLTHEVQVEGFTPFHKVRSSSIQVYTAPLNSTMTVTVDCLPCKGTNQQRRRS